MSSQLLVAVVGLFSTMAFAQVEAGEQKPGTAQLLEKKILLTGPELDGVALFEVLQKVSKKHGLTFVVMEEQFRARDIRDIRERTSPLKKFDPSGLTVRQFLTVWLGSIDATYRANADYVEIVPLATANEPGVHHPALPADPFEALLAKLHRDEMVPLGGTINEVPLFEIVKQLSVRHEVSFVINEESFRAAGTVDIKTKTASVTATRLRGQTLHQFLTTLLDDLGATYLIKGQVIEIVAPAYASRVAKAAAQSDENGRTVIKEPLVSAVFREKPFHEAVAAIAERFGLTIIISKRAGDTGSEPVTARLLNVPADKALELLALQADLRIVRKGTAYLITSREHAEELFSEEIDRRRARIDIEKLQTWPPMPIEAPAPQPRLQK